MSETTTCLECGGGGVRYQPFSGGKEYYCPHCDDVYPYDYVREPSPMIDIVAFFDTAIKAVLDAVDCQGMMCAGPDEPFEDMITCRVCALVQHFREEREKWRLLDSS